jgi:methionyl-tRNA formyltransferase
LAGEAVKVWRVRAASGQGEPGRILGWHDDGPEVTCGQGSVVVTEAQRPGGKRGSAAVVLQALGLQPGQLWA